ncbi:MFS general substrate transporter [Suillus decipiens]|nr:MFS general substrate transporter [Suillus decipiens]
MSVKSAIHTTFTTNEKLDVLEELGHIPSSNSHTTCSESGPPDGGFRAWGTVFGCFLIQFCGFGLVLVPLVRGIYQSIALEQILSIFWSLSSVRWIGALTAFLALSVTLISGPLYDRGWFHRLIIAGSLLQSLALFALSFTKPGQFYLAFMFQGVLAGLGMGLTYGPSIAVISQHFSKKRTLAMSFVASGTPLGAIIHPIMLNHFLNGSVGFARGVLASAGFVSALLLIACLCMRTRELPVPTVSCIVVAQKCFRDVLFIILTVGLTLFQIGFFFPVFYLQLDSIKHGINIDFSFYSVRLKLAIMNAASFIGRCMTGIIAPYTGVLNLMIVSTVACSAIIISMIALSDTGSMVLLGLAYGYFSGIFIALMVPLVTSFTPDLSELGARMGICFAFAAFSGLLGGPISGALLGSQYRWWIASLFSGLMALVGSLMFVVMRLMIYRREMNGKYH